jgi:signal transduction histidine kinase
MRRGELMIDPAKSTIDFSASIPVGAAPLESILCTEELLNRPWRPPDHEMENSALVALVSTLADSPRTILQTLADKVLEILDADSSGLSLLTKDEKRFYWAAISGAWRPHIGGGTPRDFGPCGDVLDHNIPMLFTHWERRYPYLSTAVPLADEGLLIPFYVSGKAVGTIWVIAHNSRRKFDAEDLRLLESMGRFASAAYQTVESIEDLKLEIAAREKAEMQTKLAHANRVATMSQLSASITHEVSQPIGAAATHASAALRWLRRQPLNVEEALLALNGVADSTKRAGEILAGIRALVAKAPRQKEPFEINEAIREVILLAQGEVRKNSISVVMELGEGLPHLEGDRIQLQQVMLNLINNAVQAMSAAGAAGIESRVLVISSKTDCDGIVVSIRDSGPGLDSANPERVFEAFYTSKPDGLGMGLSICRSIIEAHGGRLWASANAPRGATFQFTVPARDGGR